MVTGGQAHRVRIEPGRRLQRRLRDERRRLRLPRPARDPARLRGRVPDLVAEWEDIAFASDRAGRWEIFAIDLDGRHERRITRAGGKAPGWSPRGPLIAYQGPRGSAAGEHGMNSLWLVGTDGRRVPRGARNSVVPAWRPDGKAILVTRTGRGLVLMSLGGRVRARVAPPPAIDADWAR